MNQAILIDRLREAFEDQFKPLEGEAKIRRDQELLAEIDKELGTYEISFKFNPDRQFFLSMMDELSGYQLEDVVEGFVSQIIEMVKDRVDELYSGGARVFDVTYKRIENDRGPSTKSKPSQS